MPFKSNAPDLEPRDPAAYPQYPQRDARAVRPVYLFEDAEGSTVPDDLLAAAADDASEQPASPVQVQTPRDPEAYPAFPPRR